MRLRSLSRCSPDPQQRSRAVRRLTTGYAVFLHSFRDGGLLPLPVPSVRTALAPYGHLQEEDGKLNFWLALPNAADHVTVSQAADGGVTAFSISRPGPPELLRPFLYAAVTRLAMAFFTQEADVVWVRPGAAADLPAELADRADVRAVHSVADLWA